MSHEAVTTRASRHLVRSGGRARREDAGQFVQHPVECFGAFSRFMCFFGPRAMAARSFVYGTNYREGRRMRATKKASDRSAAAIARSRERID
jgi:hypothetical protein